LKTATAVSPANTAAMIEKTRTFLRFLDFAILVSYSDTLRVILFHRKARSTGPEDSARMYCRSLMRPSA
jgi:hypothetical protein